MSQETARVNVIALGHVDTGKSFIIGELLIQRYPNPLQTQPDFHDVWGKCYLKTKFVNKLRFEQELGLTVELTFNKYETSKTLFTLIDAPGHRDYMKNLVTGVSQADVALLVIDASMGAFEAGISKHGQTLEHLLIASTFGIKQLIVLVNKMDDSTVKYSEERYLKIKKELGARLMKLGYDSEKTPFIPISAWQRENLVEKIDPRMSWWKGPTALEALESISPPPRHREKPLRFLIRAVYKITGVGTVVVGKVETGTLKQGQSVSFAPTGIQATVKTIEMYQTEIAEATAGDAVGFLVIGVHYRDIKQGYICGNALDPPRPAASFVALIVVVDHPGEIKVGYTPVVHCHSAHVTCKVQTILALVEKKTNNVIEKNPKCIKQGQAALVTLVPLKQMVVERYSDYPSLGRIVVRDSQRTIAIGVVKEVSKHQQPL